MNKIINLHWDKSLEEQQAILERVSLSISEKVWETEENIKKLFEENPNEIDKIHWEINRHISWMDKKKKEYFYSEENTDDEKDMLKSEIMTLLGKVKKHIETLKIIQEHIGNTKSITIFNDNYSGNIVDTIKDYFKKIDLEISFTKKIKDISPTKEEIQSYLYNKLNTIEEGQTMPSKRVG